MAAASNRLIKELNILKGTPVTGFDITDTTDIFNWFGLFTTDLSSPYNGKTYPIHIRFSQTYPFKPPTVEFLEPVYPLHPSIINEKKNDSHGNVCLKILTPDGWGPTRLVSNVIEDLRALMLNVV